MNVTFKGEFVVHTGLVLCTLKIEFLHSESSSGNLKEKQNLLYEGGIIFLSLNLVDFLYPECLFSAHADQDLLTLEVHLTEANPVRCIPKVSSSCLLL
jgi:hypothetical protein